MVQTTQTGAGAAAASVQGWMDRRHRGSYQTFQVKAVAVARRGFHSVEAVSMTGAAAFEGVAAAAEGPLSAADVRHSAVEAGAEIDRRFAAVEEAADSMIGLSQAIMTDSISMISFNLFLLLFFWQHIGKCHII